MYIKDVFTNEELKEIYENLNIQKIGLESQYWIIYKKLKLLEYIEYLKEENKRLKSGNFTEEEFQNLCHSFTSEDKCRFKKGCEEYQKKLFGE